jgi:hypothetical protein
MHLSKLILFTCFLFYLHNATGQQIKIIAESNRNTSIRALSCAGKNVVWAAGSNGQIAKTLDGGRHWEWITVKDFANRDFRSIYAINANEAIIAAVGEPAVILKTNNGGKEWKIVWQNNTPGMFLDALFFTNAKHGWVVGDPIHNQQPFLAFTNNGGNNWQIKTDNIPVLLKGEAFFAASNSNLFVWKDQFEPWMITGGTASVLYTPIKAYPLPLLQGKATEGANSIDCFKNTCIVVGGDFMHDTLAKGNAVIIKTKPDIQLEVPKQLPGGYRSCIKHIKDNMWICCGTSGVDISNDNGMHWKTITSASFHTIAVSQNNNIFLAGNQGRIAELILK